MVKAVAVLGSSDGVKGTIFFTQEGDGKPFHILWYGVFGSTKLKFSPYHIECLNDNYEY